MNKTGIEWTDYTLNPVKGYCPVNCTTPDGKEYCYARKIYRRFKISKTIRFDRACLEGLERLNYKKEPQRIFLCSAVEMFHPCVKKEWRDELFTAIAKYPRHTFQILTKMPENIDRPMPENVHLGVSITGDPEVYDRYQGLLDAKARIKFVSFEPLLKPIYLPIRIDWAIIGRLTGCGKKYDPSFTMVDIMRRKYQIEKIPIFLKNNLIPIMGKEYVMKYRKFPK